MNNVSYERRSVESILKFLQDKAVELSDGRWTDFSSGDIGSVFLGLMAYLADMNNFQIDKTASELYLDTAVERASIISMSKLIGYEPRHYESASVVVELATAQEITNTVIPRYTTFTNESNSIIYTILEDLPITNGVGAGVAYEGTRSVFTYGYNQITPTGRIYLSDYKLGINTVQLFISGLGTGDGEIERVEDVRFITGEFKFSVHVDTDARVYIQLPSYWSDLITESSSILVSYLLTQGEAGRIGKNILNSVGSTTTLMATYTITNPQPSVGGYFPETIDELKVNIPRSARTMETIVTKKDFNDLVMNMPDIASIKCGDYNDDWTGYVQPTPGPEGVVNDAYKALVLAVPKPTIYGSLFEDIYDYDEVAQISDGETYTGSTGHVIEYDTNTYSFFFNYIHQYINTIVIDGNTTPTKECNLNDSRPVYRIDDSLKSSGGKRVIYELTLKEEHQPTLILQQLIKYVDERRLASLYITYNDPKRKTPNIQLYVYVNENDARRDSIAEDIESFMKQHYNREYCTIGKSLKGSVIGRDLHLAFSNITYVEVNPPQYKIDVESDEYIDMYYSKFRIYVNDILYIDEWEGK